MPQKSSIQGFSQRSLRPTISKRHALYILVRTVYPGEHLFNWAFGCAGSIGLWVRRLAVDAEQLNKS